LGYKTPQEIINKYYKKKNPKHWVFGLRGVGRIGYWFIF
jgi:hypothetical protein